LAQAAPAAAVSAVPNAWRGFAALEVATARSGPAARLDPRALVLATFAFILTVVSFDRYAVAGLLPLLAFPLLMAAWADVDLRWVLRKVLLAAPFAVMVGLFNPWFDQRVMLDLEGVQVTGGWVSLLAIVLRVVLTVAAALVLVASVGLPQLCIALERLGLPRVLATQLLLMQRYAAVLGGEAARMRLAHALRAGPQRRLTLPVYASLVGHLLLRATGRGQRIHQAMLARGFNGRLPTGPALPWRWQDSVFLLGCVATFLLVRLAEPVPWLGQMLLKGMM